MELNQSNQQVKKNLNTAASTVGNYAKSAQAKASDSANTVEKNLESAVHQGKEQLEDLYQNASTYVKDASEKLLLQGRAATDQAVAVMKSRPLTSIVAAAGVGVLVGIGARRLITRNAR